MTLPLQHTFSAIIAAPSRAGKTTWVAKLLKNKKEMISPPPDKIYFSYSQFQPLYTEHFSDVEFCHGVIDIDAIDETQNNLIIYDDQMDDCDDTIEKIFTKFGHHKNISVIFITQNLFQKGKHMRTMSLNASYLILFKNPRDIQQIGYLARQMYPKKQSNFLQEAYRNATSEPFGYLLIDMRQETPDIARLRSGIFPDEITYIYVPNHMIASLPRCQSLGVEHE